MITYLVTFPNIFDTAKFNKTFTEYFDVVYKIDLIIHSPKFCTIQVKGNGQFYYHQAKKDFPGIKILLKQHFGKKIKYAKL